MFRLLLIVLVVAVALGGWYVHGHYTIDVRRNGDGGIESVKFVPLAGRGVEAADDSADVPPAPARATIRIATFNVDGLDENKLANHTVSDTLVRVLPHFDVIALQGIRSKSRGLLVHLVEQVNATGRSYDFATDAAALRDGPAQYNAVLFDRASVEMDRSTVHFVGDPTGSFSPQAAGGGVSRPRADRGRGLHLHADRRADRSDARGRRELDLLAAVFRAVRDDGRNEDDIILLGDLEADHRAPRPIGPRAQSHRGRDRRPTTTRGTRLADNILFDRRATVEFTGRSGVYDLMRECDLSLQAALDGLRAPAGLGRVQRLRGRPAGSRALSRAVYPCHGCISRALGTSAVATPARLTQPWHAMNNPHWSGNSRPRAAAVRPTRRLFGKDIPIMLVVWGIGPVRVGGIVAPVSTLPTIT